jgi:hypothetical protein
MRGRFLQFLRNARTRHVILNARRYHSIISSSSFPKPSLKLSIYTRLRAEAHGRRSFSFDAIPTVLLPPVVFTGLLLTLWTYKCLMMVVFQNKIIYMPNVPPFSRSEKVEDYARRCLPIAWQEHTIITADGVAIKLLAGGKKDDKLSNTGHKSERPHVVTVYFQGSVLA